MTKFTKELMETFGYDELQVYQIIFTKYQRRKYTVYYRNLQRYYRQTNRVPISLKSPSEYLGKDYVDSMTFDKIALELGISYHLVRKYYASAMLKIKNIIETNDKYKELKDFIN